MRKLTFEELQASRPSNEVLRKIPRTPVTALLDDIRSLNNVGSIFRTSDAVNLQHLYLCGITGTPPRNEIRKASLGAEESVPWSYFQNPVGLVQILKNDGYQIVALEHTTKSLDYREAEFRYPLCLMIGHEFNGIRDELIEMADMAIEIPMHGMKQSLNVSVAFSIAIYQIYSYWEDNYKT